MSKTTKLKVWGGFHNTTDTITFRVSKELFEEFPHNVGWEELLSESQYKRLCNHLCGIKGCSCGGHFHPQWQEV